MASIARISRVLVTAAALLCGTTAYVDSAGAHTDGCVGTGEMLLDEGLTLATTPKQDVGFSLKLVTATCSSFSQFLANGQISGSCETTIGTGTTTTGHAFSFTGLSGLLAFAGGVTGTAVVTPSVLGGDSCVALQGAKLWIVNAAALVLL